jgi:hypothetical protein
VVTNVAGFSYVVLSRNRSDDEILFESLLISAEFFLFPKMNFEVYEKLKSRGSGF